jgi:Methyltransferase domain
MDTSGVGGSDSVRQFFDQQQDDNRYASLKEQTRALDRAAADHLHESVRGDVLAVGGVWDHFRWVPSISSLTVLDLSSEMLDDYCPDGAAAVEGDLYHVEFSPSSFDTIVFPLMLHHTPVAGWRRSEQRVRDAIARASTWLRPGGHVFVVEYCPNVFWNPIQRAAFPLTRRFLAAFGQPPVVMYPRAFYEGVLRERFGAVTVERIDPPGFDYWTWYPVFMAVRWLRIPLALYPKLHVFCAGTAIEGANTAPVNTETVSNPLSR